jgi:peptidyl-prolyl cis-trans isomerase D
MAVIGKIRQRSGLLLIVIGGAMVAFVLSDLFSNQGGTQQQYVGEIDGNSIDRMVYEQRVQKELDSRNSLGQATTAQMTQSIRNTVWNNMVREMVMFPQMEKLGLEITQEEFDDLTMGDNILPEFRNDQTFINKETGQFDRELVKQYLTFVQSTPQYATYWELQRKRIISDRMYGKYHNMIKGGIIANQLEGKSEYYGANLKADMQFVMKPYTAIVDSTVTISESELKAYYNEHKKEDRYKQSETRSFDYVEYTVVPTAADTQAIFGYLADLVEDFQSSTKDSLFVVNNSDSRTFMRTVHKPGGTVSPEVDAMINAADSGQVVGPYRNGSIVVITKVLDKVQEEQARVRHILLTTEGKDKETVKARADSLLKVVKSKKNFEEMVTQFSDDPGSKSTGGVYEWFNRERMVPEFTEASFNKKVGETTICETTYGFHIVEVLGQRKEDQQRVIHLDQTIEPSNDTFDDVYQLANSFSLNSSNAESFNKAAAEAGMEVKKAENISRLATAVGNFSDPTELVRWAFSKKKDAVSEPIELDLSIVVAVITSVKEEGIIAFEDAKKDIEAIVINDKKAELMMQEMKGAASLSELATKIGQTVQGAPNVTFNTTSLGGASEPAVAAKALTLEAGQMSLPLKGTRGVYVVQVDAVNPPIEVDVYDTETKTLGTRYSGRVVNEVFNALKEKAEVKDERSKFY